MSGEKVIEPGEKIHVAFRRLFEGDMRRHFIGEVVIATESMIRAQGYTHLFDPRANLWVRHPEFRVRLISLTDETAMINVLPRDASPEAAGYAVNDAGHLVMTDGETFALEVNEFGVTH